MDPLPRDAAHGWIVDPYEALALLLRQSLPWGPTWDGHRTTTTTSTTTSTTTTTE